MFLLVDSTREDERRRCSSAQEGSAMHITEKEVVDIFVSDKRDTYILESDLHFSHVLDSFKIENTLGKKDDGDERSQSFASFFFLMMLRTSLTQLFSYN